MSTYFCRKRKTLFEISSSKVSQNKFKGKLKSYPDSGIGVVQNGKIILIGGSDSSKALTNRVFLIDPINKTATELPSVPKPVKAGRVFEYQNYFYYIGGTTESDDIETNTTEEGAPIMRFNIKDNQ